MTEKSSFEFLSVAFLEKIVKSFHVSFFPSKVPAPGSRMLEDPGITGSVVLHNKILLFFVRYFPKWYLENKEQKPKNFFSCTAKTRKKIASTVSSCT